VTQQPAQPQPEPTITRTAAITPPLPGDVPPPTVVELGRLREYVLLEKIGHGGMGTVYRAVHTHLDKVFAVKTLPEGCMSNPEAVARFQREMKAVGKLNHPNIVQATDAGEVDGTHFLVMEYVAGADLAVAVGRLGPLPVAAACEVVRQAALGLAHAHEHGLIHRDAKPSNLLLSTAGQVKVVDLGLALLHGGVTDDGEHTPSGAFMGTFDYMAPEQADDPHAVTAQADVYSLGCTLYHLLTGRPPFAQHSGMGRKVRAHAADPVRPVRATRPEVPASLEALVLRMLAKSPGDRPAGAAALAAALAPLAAGADLPALAAAAAVPSTTTAARETVGRVGPTRNRRRNVLLVAVVLLAVAGLTAWLWPRRPATGGPVDGNTEEAEVELTPIAFPRPPVAEPGELRAFRGHADQVNSIAVTRDGRFIVSGGNDATVIVWDTATGHELCRGQGMTEAVWAVAVSPDGSRLLAAGGGSFVDGAWADAKDLDLHLLDLATGAELRRLAGHTDLVNAVAFTANGRRALSCSNDGTLRLWDVRSGRWLRKFQGHAGPVNTFAVSADGKRLVSGGADGTVRLWDVESGLEVRTFDGEHDGTVIGVALSPDGRLALSGGRDRTLRLWDVTTGQEVRRFADQPTAVTAVAFSPDGRRALSAGGSLHTEDGPGWSPAGFDNCLRLWDVATGRELCRFEGHEDALTSAAFTPDGYHALSGSCDATVRLWRLPEPLAVVPFSEDEAREQQRRWAALVKSSETTTNSLGMELKLVPPGEFARDENARAQVTRPFYMGRCEVTIGQFRKFVEATKYKTEAERSPDGGAVGRADGTWAWSLEFTWRHKDVSQGDDYPVGHVAWNDAARFCAWLSKRESKVYRLPTEAEWEWACRAGSAGPWSFGDGAIEDHAWVLSNSGRRSHPVGTRRPNAWGLCDLYGNHAEFCGDWFGDYPAGTVADPTGAASSGFRVIRGAGFIDEATESGSRYSADPTLAMSHFGFRVVCEVARERRSAPRVVTLIDADAREYEAWLARLRADGLRPAFVQARDAGGAPRFQSIAVRDARPVSWEASVGLSEDADVKRFETLSAQQYRTLCCCGYREGGQLRFASIYARESPPLGGYSFFQMTNAELTGKVAELNKQGFRATSVQGYSDGQQVYFASTFVPERSKHSEVQLAIAAPRLDAVLAEHRERGLRPISLGAHLSPTGPRHSVVWVADKPAVAWESRSGLSAAQYREEEDAWSSRGYRPLSVVGYDRQGRTEYAALWVRDGLGEPPLPRSGRLVPELSAFDRAMTEFMRERRIPAGTLAVIKDGKLLLSRGYGWSDRERTKPIAADAPFRLASLTKPMTAAAVRKLIRDGKLRGDTKVFDLLGLEPPPGHALDPRWKKVTVDHLLDHRGGWDIKKLNFDPMFYSGPICEALGKRGPAAPDDVIRYMAGQSLQFEPGMKSVYSNFGYCLLGRVIEKASGKSYLDYLRRDVLEPAGIKGVALGQTLPADRDPREPFYSDPNRDPNLMRPDSKEKVPAPDGGFCLESLDAHGGLIASAPDVAQFVAAFQLDGQPADGKVHPGAAFGSLPGTFTMALVRPDGVGIVVLFNQRTDPSGLDYDAIEEVMNRAAGEVKSRP
jgi:WD40 repeat protein/CubicO group peptidase (beta-lactamase class C family)